MLPIGTKSDIGLRTANVCFRGQSGHRKLLAEHAKHPEHGRQNRRRQQARGRD
jgi:hypothetical protein